MRVFTSSEYFGLAIDVSRLHQCWAARGAVRYLELALHNLPRLCRPCFHPTYKITRHVDLLITPAEELTEFDERCPVFDFLAGGGWSLETEFEPVLSWDAQPLE